MHLPRPNPAVAAIVVLSLVVLGHHAFRVATGDLSPWKGGGMGMFSTRDLPANRVVSVEIATLQGRFVAAAGDHEALLRDYRAEPVVARLSAICSTLAATDWYDSGRSVVPAAGGPAVPVATSRRPADPGDGPLDVIRLEVRGWRVMVEAADGSVAYEPLGTMVHEQGRAGCDLSG